MSFKFRVKLLRTSLEIRIFTSAVRVLILVCTPSLRMVDQIRY